MCGRPTGRQRSILSSGDSVVRAALPSYQHQPSLARTALGVKRPHVCAEDLAMAQGSRSRRFVKGRNRERERPFMHRLRIGQGLCCLAAAACVGIINDGFLRGFMVGITLSAIPLLQAHVRGMAGSEFRLMGPEAELWTAKELRSLDASWQVFHNVGFDGLDVDHVAVSDTCMLAVETKWSADPTSWTSHRARQDLRGQALKGADKVRMMTRAPRVITLVACWAPGRSRDPVHTIGDGVYLVGGRQVVAAIEQIVAIEPRIAIQPESVQRLADYHARFKPRQDHQSGLERVRQRLIPSRAT